MVSELGRDSCEGDALADTGPQVYKSLEEIVIIRTTESDASCEKLSVHQRKTVKANGD